MQALRSAVEDIEAPLLYRGKVRELFDLGDELLVVVTDRISAHDLRLEPPIPGKGDALNRLAEFWFQETTHLQANHLIHTDVERLVEEGVLEASKAERYRNRVMVVKKARRIDIECVARGYLAGAGWRQYEASGQINGVELPRGLRKNERLKAPIFTPALKKDEGHDEDLSFEEVVDFVGQQLAEELRAKTLELYEFAHELCQKKGLILADCKLEFGFVGDELVLIDECFTPDSARFWPQERYELGGEIDSFDKEPVRQFLLREERERGEMPTVLPPDVVEEVSRRYGEVWRRTGTSAVQLMRTGTSALRLQQGIFEALWSEHCSYKNSKPVLAQFPTEGEQVILGPGEGAGVVDIGDGQALVFKMESHNRPTAIEPYQGAATGAGGILRDVFSMGARPVALLGALRFGPLEQERSQYLLRGALEGIADYGAQIGVPTLEMDLGFDEVYRDNPLVNVMAVGIVAKDRVQRGRADGVGNIVLYAGAPTGRDGIDGAAFASEGLGEDVQKSQGAMQIADAQMGKRVMEACLELIEAGVVVGIQDMGAAGLSSSSAEMASKAGTGMELVLDKVPRVDEAMVPYEIMLSESQERMLIVLRGADKAVAEQIFAKWEVPCAQIGQVIEERQLRLIFDGEVVADLSVRELVDEAPVCERAVVEPEYLRTVWAVDLLNSPELSGQEALSQALEVLLGRPNLGSRRWVYERLGGSAGEAVVEIPGSSKLLAMTVVGKERAVYLDPFQGGKATVVEAARRLVCRGAKPLAVTDNLNFGNPERPHIYYQLHEAVAGMAKACRALKTPVVSGNVSLFNESPTSEIYPTPTVGMVGLIEEAKHRRAGHFVASGDQIVLLGETKAEMGGSALRAELFEKHDGMPPVVDLEVEAKLQDTLLQGIGTGLVRSAQSLEEGGLAVALARCAIEGGLGARVEISTDMRPDHFLFSESTSRVVVTVEAEHFDQFMVLIGDAQVPARVLGEVGGDCLEIAMNGEAVIRRTISSLKELWEGALPRWMAT